MRVLHIMSGFGGGISTFIYNKATALKDRNVVFDVVTYDSCSEQFIEAIQETGGNVYSLLNPKKEGWKAFINSFEAVFQHFHYDVVHCHINGYRALPYYVIAKKYVERFYIHAHDSRSLYQSGLKNKMEQFIDRRINQRLSDIPLGCGELAIQSSYGNIPHSSQLIIPNSIDIERFLMDNELFALQKERLRLQYGIENHQLVVGHIGRLKPVKNMTFTINLAKLAQDKLLPIRFFIVGGGPLEASLKQLTIEKGLDQQLTFLGRVEPIESLLPLFDVLVLPSVYEGLPTIAVESQAMGIPILMNTSITTEVDFGLGLVKYLNADVLSKEWLTAIQQMGQIERPSIEQRLQAIQDHQFTNELSAELYLAFLQGKIMSYQLRKE